MNKYAANGTVEIQSRYLVTLLKWLALEAMPQGLAALISGGVEKYSWLMPSWRRDASFNASDLAGFLRDNLWECWSEEMLLKKTTLIKRVQTGFKKLWK
jgi:hypothetical protein